MESCTTHPWNSGSVKPQYSAKEIRQLQDTESFVIGVTGKWGSGKSSFLNLIEQELCEKSNDLLSDISSSRKQHSADSIVIRFNPWIIEDRTQLLSALFLEIASNIKEDKILKEEKCDSIIGSFKDYLNSIKDPAEAFVGAAADILAPGTSLLARLLVRSGMSIAARQQPAENKYIALSKTREKLCKELASLDGNIVVFVDDIDRLDSKEICEVFKLVNLTASFPHFVYVLAYDQHVVKAALDAIDNDGHDYLEKIVQYTFNLPPLTRRDLRATIDAMFKESLEDFGFFGVQDEVESRRLEDFIEEHLINMLETPRQLTRYSNTLRMQAGAVGRDICPSDFVAMCMIQLFYPNVFCWIWQDRAALCDGTFTWHGANDAEPIAISKRFESACSKDGLDCVSGKQLILKLFPEYARLTNTFNTSKSDNAYAKGRICEQRLLELFYGITGSSIYSRTDILSAVNSDNPFEINIAIEKLLQAEQLVDYVEVLDEQCLSMSDKAFSTSIKALLLALGKSQEPAALFDRSVDQLINRYIERMLIKCYGACGSDWLLDEIIDLPLENFFRLIWLIRDERLIHLGNSERSAVFSEQGYITLARAFIDSVHMNLKLALHQLDSPILVFYVSLCKDFSMDCWIADQRLIEEDPMLKALVARYQLSIWHGADDVSYELNKKKDRVINIAVSAEEIESYSREPWFVTLPQTLQDELAALYLLLNGSSRVSASEAKDLLAFWGV